MFVSDIYISGCVLLLFFCLSASTCISLPWTPFAVHGETYKQFSNAVLLQANELIDSRKLTMLSAPSVYTFLPFRSKHLNGSKFIFHSSFCASFMTGNKLQPSLPLHKFSDDLHFKMSALPIVNTGVVIRTATLIQNKPYDLKNCMQPYYFLAKDRKTSFPLGELSCDMTASSYNNSD